MCGVWARLALAALGPTTSRSTTSVATSASRTWKGLQSRRQRRFRFIGFSLKIKGGTGSPIRPIAWLDG
jgi:hypothetical protein